MLISHQNMKESVFRDEHTTFWPSCKTHKLKIMHISIYAHQPHSTMLCLVQKRSSSTLSSLLALSLRQKTGKHRMICEAISTEGSWIQKCIPYFQKFQNRVYWSFHLRRIMLFFVWSVTESLSEVHWGLCLKQDKMWEHTPLQGSEGVAG